MMMMMNDKKEIIPHWISTHLFH